jgi:Flp pilus assembly protein TadD
MLNWLGKFLRGPSPGIPAEEALRALLAQALASRRAGRAEEAERVLYRALALAPGSAEVQLHLGDLFRELGRHEAALDCCREAVRLAPDSAQARNNLGNACRAVGREDEALEHYRQAVALDPALPEAHFNLAVALQKRGDKAEALRCYRVALQGRPDLAVAHLNLGLLLEEREEVEDAIAAYRAAIGLEQDLVEAHVNLGMQLLLAGRLAEGWPEYEWRLRYPEYAAAAGVPRWDGADAGGRTILLDAEQGYGDAIQFVRYAPLVAARGARVVLRCAPELAGLLRAAPGVADAVARGGATPSFDLHCPLPSLPGVFGTTLDSVPAGVPYVFADSAKAARWQARLAGDGRKIGLVWASQSGHRTAAAKSLPLQALAPLAEVPGLQFYSLQLGEAARQLQSPPPGLRVEDLGRELADFSDTAAVMANLDLVISVDTATAHLAGALARPAWTLLKFAPDWRWLLGREDCPWYPTMRLFRQEREGDWRGTVERLAGALRRFAA